MDSSSIAQLITTLRQIAAFVTNEAILLAGGIDVIQRSPLDPPIPFACFLSMAEV